MKMADGGVDSVDS